MLPLSKTGGSSSRLYPSGTLQRNSFDTMLSYDALSSARNTRLRIHDTVLLRHGPV